ncbi:hypothetical protein DFQ30_011131, partial [Apophysomyces sp. BC1015]
MDVMIDSPRLDPISFPQPGCIKSQAHSSLDKTVGGAAQQIQIESWFRAQTVPSHLRPLLGTVVDQARFAFPHCAVRTVTGSNIGSDFTSHAPFLDVVNGHRSPHPTIVAADWRLSHFSEPVRAAIVMTSNSPSSLDALARELFSNDVPAARDGTPAAQSQATGAPADTVSATPPLTAAATPTHTTAANTAATPPELAAKADTMDKGTQCADGFAALGLSPEIVSALIAAGYNAPTPVQQRAIPAALAGRDLLVSSPTGSGKTAAFMLPAIERFAQMQKAGMLGQRAGQPPHHAQRGDRGERRHRREQPVAQPTLLVLTPTRELAMQVSTAATAYGKHLRRLRTVSILGGVAYGQQLMLLAKNPEILVATPGRLIDHLERGRIDLSQLQML